MLQWMGGSRRKLRASAKSLKARQQQFFELRRQEQRERGKVANGVAAAGNVAEEGPRHRSLDILGLEELRCGAPSAHEPQTVPGADQAHRSGQASTSLRKQEETARSPQAIVKTTTESKHTQQENDKPESTHVTRRTAREGVTSHQSDSRRKKTPNKSTTSAENASRGLGCETGFKILDIINERGAEVSTKKSPSESYATFTVQDDGKEKRHAPNTSAGAGPELSFSQRTRREREVTRKDFPVLANRRSPSKSSNGTSELKGYRSTRPKQSSQNLEISKEFQADFWGREEWSPTWSDRRTLPLEYVEAAENSTRPWRPDHESDLWTSPDFKLSTEDTYLEANASPLPSAAKYSQNSVLLTGNHPNDSSSYANQFSVWSPTRLNDTEVARFDEDDRYFGSPESAQRISREDSFGRSICPDTYDFEHDLSRSFSTSSRQVMDHEPPEPPTSSHDFGLDKIAYGEQAIPKPCLSDFQSQRLSMDGTLPPDDWFDSILPSRRSSSPPVRDNDSGSFFGDHRAQTRSDVQSGTFELEPIFTEDTSSVDDWVMKPKSPTSSGAYLCGAGGSRVSKFDTQYLRHSSEHLFTNDTEAEISFERNLNSTRSGDESYRPALDSSTKTSGLFEDKDGDILESTLCLSPGGFSPVREATVDTVGITYFSPGTQNRVSDNTADIFASSLFLSPGGSGTQREPTLDTSDTVRTMQTYLSPITQNKCASDNLLSSSDEFLRTNEFDLEGATSIRTEGSLSISKDTREVGFSMFVQNFEAETGRPNAETLIVYFPPAKGERERSFCPPRSPNFAEQNGHASASHTNDEDNYFAVCSKGASSLQRSASKETSHYDKGKEKIHPEASWAETGDELFANRSAADDKEIGVELPANKGEVNALNRKLRQFELEFLQSTSMTCATKTTLSYPEPCSPKPWDKPKAEFRVTSQRASTSTDDFGFPVARINNQVQRDPSKNDESFTSWRAGWDTSGPNNILSDQFRESAERGETQDGTKDYQWEIDETPDISHDSKKRGGTDREWAPLSQSRAQRESHDSNAERQGRKRNKSETLFARESRPSEKQRQLFHGDDQADDKVQRHETSLGYSRNKTSREAACSSHKQNFLNVGESERSHRQDALRRPERTSSDKRDIQLKNKDSRAVLRQRTSLRDRDPASGGDVADHHSPETNRNSAHSNASQERLDIQTTCQRSSLLTRIRGKRQSSVTRNDTTAFRPSSKEREDPADDQTQLLECESSNKDGQTTTIPDRHDGGSKQTYSNSNKTREDKTHFHPKETLQKEATSLTTSRKYCGSKRSTSTEVQRWQTAARSSNQQSNDFDKEETVGGKAALHQSHHPEEQQEPDRQEKGHCDLPQQTEHTTGPSLPLLEPSSPRTPLGSQQPIHRSSQATELETTELLTRESTAHLSEGKKLPELCVASESAEKLTELCVGSESSPNPLQSTPEGAAAAEVSRAEGRAGTPYVTMLETFIEQLRFENRLLQDIMEKQN